MNRRLIVGLGNTPYPSSRHSVGHLFLDFMHETLRFSPWTARGSSVGRSSLPRHRASPMLLKPRDLMNLSGFSVKEALKMEALGPSHLVIVQDDMDRKLGALSWKEKGSANGHNGIRSVISLLGTDAFVRLRIGIDRPDSKDKRVISDYVLEDFSREEMDVLRKIVFPKALGMLIERGILE